MPPVFDDAHYASSLWQKVVRSVELGPRYYLWDLPRYYRRCRQLRLRGWDLEAIGNPLREFRRHPFTALPGVPQYVEALERLVSAGVRLSIPRVRLEALLGIWWTTRYVAGDVIECGSYRGATALLLALLSELNGLDRRTLLLDTFAGTPHTSRYDISRRRGEFVPAADQVEQIRRQADLLGVLDRIEIHRGLFADTFAALAPRSPAFAFVHVDANIYQGTWEACEFTIPRTSPGGAVVFDDYNGAVDLGARLAIRRCLASHGLRARPLAASSAYLYVPAGGKR